MTKTIFENMDARNVSIKRIEIHHEEKNGFREYYLTMVWTYETKDGVYELTVPHVSLITNNHNLPILMIDKIGYLTPVTKCYMTFPKLSGQYLTIKPDADNNFYYIKELESFVKELTFEEIEKKFGHKIKLVDRKEREE